MTERLTSQYTKDDIREGILNKDNWLERAILAIYEKQTSSERIDGETKIRNGVGFNAVDSRILTYYAKWLKSGKHLTGSHKRKAREKILKYSNQLAKIANKEI